MKLLLHICCGPCFTGVWEELGVKGHSVTGYYNNPNIYPEKEHEKRLQNLRVAAEGALQSLVVSDYQPEEFLKAVARRDNAFPERCLECYRLRLKEAAQKAKELGFEGFSTTLLVSPYQNHEALRSIGEELAREYGLIFYYTDWRPYFREGQLKAKNKGLYRQKYCGCQFSLKESQPAD